MFTPDAVTLHSGAFEFEPAYELQGQGREVGYRFSSGFGKLEVGVSLDNAAVNQAVGLKYGLIPDRLAVRKVLFTGKLTAGRASGQKTSKEN